MKILQILHDIKIAHINNPIKKCPIYKEEGCAFVDSYLCNYPNCSMIDDMILGKYIKKYKNNKINIK